MSRVGWRVVAAVLLCVGVALVLYVLVVVPRAERGGPIAAKVAPVSSPIAEPLGAAEAEPVAPMEEAVAPVAIAAEPVPAAEVRRVSERILLLAPGRPVLIDLVLTIDGEPHAGALEKLIDDVLELVGSESDGRVTWKELCAHRRIKYGQYGNLAIDNENSEKQVIERYDTDRDGVVDRAELPRFLTRNAGSARPFSVRGTFDHQGQNRRAAATWQAVDADDDGQISAAEMQAAGVRLGSRDLDEDEILLAAELNPRMETPGMERQMNRRRGADAIRLLGEQADWGSVQLALEQTYGGSRSLRPDSFPQAPALFASLDKNANGRLDRGEFSHLNDLPADSELVVKFGDSQQYRPIEIVGEAAKSEGSAAGSPLANRTMALASATVTFASNDTLVSQNFSARGQETLNRLDADKNGYLEESEVPEALQNQLGRFEAVDSDADGKIYSFEITSFLALQQSGLRAQIHARATDRDDLLFAALDTNHDQRLDARELAAAAQVLAAYDQNADGNLTPEELPESLLIVFARGSLENPEATFAPPVATAAAPATGAPRWFTSMDANGDATISRREFLGVAEKFAELDRDANGLLELAEVGEEMGNSAGAVF